MTEPDVTLEAGQRYQRAGDFRQAAEVFRQLLARGAHATPLAGRIHCLLAGACRKLGEFDEARTHYEHALRVEPHNIEAYAGLANLLAERGRVAEAITCYRQGLQIQPNNAGLHNNLGIALVQQGQLDEACIHYREALRLTPHAAGTHSNLGIALARQGKLEEAKNHYEQALHLDPASSQAHYNLANLLRQMGELPEAAEHYRQALRLKPADAETHRSLAAVLVLLRKPNEAELHFRAALNYRADFVEVHIQLGAFLAQQGRGEEALAHYQEARRLRPADAEVPAGIGTALARQEKYAEAVPHYEEALRLNPNAAGVHNNLGIALVQLEKADEAIAHYRRALELASGVASAPRESAALGALTQPRSPAPDFHNNLGIALAKQGQFEEAEHHYHEALRLQPNAAGTYSNLGNALRDQGRIGEAIFCYRQALRLKPDAADVHNNMAIALAKDRSLDEAIGHYQRCLRLDPDFADAHANLAMAYLMKGDFQRGWAEYEWRWKRKGAGPLHTDHPRWDGSSLEGRTILLHAEQGHGDTLQFIRFAEMVKQRGGTVLFECPRLLVKLLSRCRGIDQIFTMGEPLPPFDVHSPLMSLPGTLGTTVETIPPAIPYLFADEELVAHWRHELERGFPSPPTPLPQGERGVRIGIAWQGNPKYGGDRHRSFLLKHVTPLTWFDNVQLYSLQKGFGFEQLTENADLPIIDIGSRVETFADTAAVIQNLDLVITTDTAIAHLAGGLGARVWLALSAVADWRWLVDREDTPWYPTMRLFRQAQLGNWEAVFVRVAGEVRKQWTAPREKEKAGSQQNQNES